MGDSTPTEAENVDPLPLIEVGVLRLDKKEGKQVMNILEMVKAYGGMVFGKTDYWHPDMNMNSELSLGELRKYPVAMFTKADYFGKFDQNKIPLVQVDNDLCYLPVTIAQYALGNYDRYLDTRNPESLKALMICADWFVDQLVECRPKLWGWQNEHDKDIYVLKKPWLSALSQGQALSVLARAYQEVHQAKYLETALLALKAFFVPIEQGGLVARLDEGEFFEEYPSTIPSFVLNGFIFALWGLWDLFLVSESAEAKERYEVGLKTLKEHIKDYKIGWGWSRYDLYPFQITDIASIFYHKLHIQQLRAMYRLTQYEPFIKIAEAWERGQHNKLAYTLATGYKVIHKLSIRRKSSYVPNVK